MARDRANIRTDIWADGDFRKLSIYAQWLYMTLLTHPTLSYAGVADWRPGRIAVFSESAETSDIQDAARELMSGRFILVDEETEEVLVRSFIKHDGLLKQPKLTVSMCNAYAAIASTSLREVVAFEIQKLRSLEPDLRAWGVKQMQTVLGADARPIDDHLPEGLGEGLPLGLPFGLPQTQGLGLGLPTSTATTTATPQLEIGGAPSAPSMFCERHPQGTDAPCRACAVAWKAYESWLDERDPTEGGHEHAHRWLNDGTCIGCEEQHGAA